MLRIGSSNQAMRYVLFGCLVGILLFTCTQLTVKNKRPLHYCMIYACCCLCYELLYFWAVEAGYIRYLPALALSDVPVLIAMIPGFYLAALSILYEGKRPVRSYTAYFAVFVPIAVIVGCYTAFTAHTHFLDRGSILSRFEHPVLGPVSLIVFSMVTVVIALDLLAAFRLHRSGRTAYTSAFRIQVVILLLYLLSSFMLWPGFFLRNERLISLSMMIFGCLALGFAVSHMTVSFISQNDAASPPRTASRLEWDETAEELSARLAALMDASAPYRDPDLTLPRLAKKLNVEPKRLSYLFNVSLSMNFRTYLNERRLRAVRRELIEVPDRSILDTALANGFNSKSSFNSLFVKAYGKTPREFRKDCPERPASDIEERVLRRLR